MPNPATDPVVTEVMEPLVPGCCGVLTAAGGEPVRWYAHLLADAEVPLPGKSGQPDVTRTVELPVVQRTGECYTVEVPDVPAGVMALGPFPVFRLEDCWLANRPRVDWTWPAAPVPGGALRLIGRTLVGPDAYPTTDPAAPVSFGGWVTGKTRVAVRPASGGRAVECPVEKSSAYEAMARIPVTLQPGIYHLQAHNGHGGAAGWSDPLEVEIVAATPWPTTVFRVDDFLEAGNPGGHTNFDIYGNYHNPGEHLADEAIARAVVAAERNGGGVVELAGRIYDISRTIIMPPRVVLRGQGHERTWIRTPFGEGPRPPYVVITGDGPFAVEDLRIVTYYAPLAIAAPRFEAATFDEAANLPWHIFTPPMAVDVSVRRCLIHQRVGEGWGRRYPKNASEEEKKLIERINHHFGQAPDCKGSGMRFGGIRLRCRGGELVGNTILAAMDAVLLQGCSSMRVADNDLRSGAGGYSLMLCGYREWPATPEARPIRGSYLRELLLEDNILASRSDRSRNGFFFYQSGARCHMARNRILDCSRDSDGEGMGCHLWMDRWGKTRLRMTGPTVGELLDPDGELNGQDLVEAAAEIVGGRGAGQIRFIRKRDGARIELDRPWRVLPDETSLFNFVAPPPFYQIGFVDNHIENTGPNIILWGSSHDMVIDGNRTVYGPGIGIWSVNIAHRFDRIWGGAFFTQVINNRLDVGMFQPDDATILDHFHESLPQHGVIANLGYRTTPGHDFLGLVVRNNCTRNNTGIILKKTFKQSDGTVETANLAGLVVEGNYAVDSHTGLVLENGMECVDRNNRASNVTWPLVRFDRAAGRVVRQPPA